MSKTDSNEKLYYAISEVARITNLEPYVLRYWEKEFSMLNPRKNRGGSRMYTSKDIELVNRIKYLRTKEKLTIAGTRAKLTMRRPSEEQAEVRNTAKANTLIGQIRKEIEDMLEDLS